MLNGIEIIENLGDGKWSTKQFQITKETDFNSYIQKQWTIDQNCVAYKNGKFSGHDETSPMNFHYQFIHFGDVDSDGDIDISVSTADTFQWDEDYLYDKIQTRILTNTDNTIDGFILETYKRAKFIK